MRVVLLVTDLDPGGTPQRLARLARGLRDAGVDVHVGCLACPGAVSRELESAAIPTFSCGARGPRDLLALLRLTRHLRRIDPDLVHATLLHANVAARLAGLMLGIPVVTASATIEVERRWHKTVEWLTSGLDRGHLVSSQAVAVYAARAFRRRPDSIHLIPPSLEPPADATVRSPVRAALGIGRADFAVLWAGRLDPVKRIEIVLDCARMLADRGARFLIAGDGPQRGLVERAVRSSGDTAVQWLGWREDLPELMRAADAFVFPSLTEGMPNALLLAMQCGLPIVASDIPVHRELSGPAGRLVLVREPTGTAYADALRRLRADPACAARLGAACAAWATNALDPARTIDATLAVYRQVLNHPR